MNNKRIPFLLLLLCPVMLWAQSRESIDAENLHQAISGKKIEQVKKMIGSGADLNYQRNGLNALHAACKTGSLEMVAMLIAAGAEVNSVSEQGAGLTSLQLATRGDGLKKSVKMVDMLLKHDADPNIAAEGSDYPIFYAIDNQDLKVLELLLAHGARKDVINNRGQRPVEYISGMLKDPSTDAKSKEVFSKMKVTLLN